MYKLVILVQQTQNPDLAEQLWPQFLAAAEAIPGLRSETTSRVARHIFGANPFQIMHELFFDTLEAAYLGLNSLEGRQAGYVLQQLSEGKLTLFLADHHTDKIENLRPAPPPASNG